MLPETYNSDTLVAIVEDDSFLRDELVAVFAGAGFRTWALEYFENSAAQIAQAQPNLLVLDLSLPQTSGFQIIQALRAGAPALQPTAPETLPRQAAAAIPAAMPATIPAAVPTAIPAAIPAAISAAVPILVLTARDRLSDELHALDLGADDYITKPVESARLLARAQSLIRRAQAVHPDLPPILPTTNARHQTQQQTAAALPETLLDGLLQGPGFLLDSQTFTLHLPAGSSRIAPQEGRLLAVLTNNLGATVPKQELHLALWGTSEFVDENALMVTATRLRKTLKSHMLDAQIESVRGEGLCLMAIREAQDSPRTDV